MSREIFADKRGSQLISFMFNNAFYGIAMSMSIHYFRHHAYRDTLKTMLVVCILAVSATLQVLFVNYQMFSIFVDLFEKNMDRIDGDINFSVLGKYTTVSFTAFVAQMFYASRIWSIGRNMGYTGRRLKLLSIPVALLSSTQLGAGIAQIIVMQSSVTFKSLEQKSLQITEIFATQCVATAICDIVVAVSILFILRTSHSGIRRTDSLLEILIKYAIQRAAATSICGFLTILLFEYTKSTYFFHLPCLINTHCHVISVVSL
ncbi:hypothetical protein BDQ17DRAFT_242169 [Cyathus striatus]|nr:hypothetical protein BDQ17DRAFT_242169 [Cyathus striatus]